MSSTNENKTEVAAPAPTENKTGPEAAVEKLRNIEKTEGNVPFTLEHLELIKDDVKDMDACQLRSYFFKQLWKKGDIVGARSFLTEEDKDTRFRVFTHLVKKGDIPLAMTFLTPAEIEEVKKDLSKDEDPKDEPPKNELSEDELPEE